MGFENVLVIVILIGALLFGAKKLPELARALGKAQSEFEKGKRESIHGSIHEASAEVNDSRLKQNVLDSESRTGDRIT
jgi:sec-independent protein translocase protein TatA